MARSSGVAAGGGAGPCDLEPAALEAAIRKATEQLHRFVPDTDLMESLYFGWFERPYQRATLAVAMKTTAVLERELRCRRAGNAAIRDAELSAMLDWLDSALERATRDNPRPGFLPHRLRWDPGGEVAPRFAFVDRASASRYDRVLGDFDLLVCLGTGVYGLSPRTTPAGDGLKALAARADALGVGIVAETGEDSAARSASILSVRPLTLAALLTGPPRCRDFNERVARSSGAAASGGAGPCAGTQEKDHGPGTLFPDGSGTVAPVGTVPAAPNTPAGPLPAGDSGVVWAVTDPPQGETWGESLARRSLFRTVVRGQALRVVGWTPPRTSDPVPGTLPGPSVTRLAIWVHVLAGQRLGLIEGWRDLRDGSTLPYAPWVVHPAQVETIVHTALDLLYYRRELSAFGATAPVAVALDETALSPDDEDRWSEEAAELFSVFLDRQLRFEVVPAWYLSSGSTGHGSRVIVLGAGDADAAGIAERLRGTVGTEVRVFVPPGGGSPGESVRYLRGLPDPIVSRDWRDPVGCVAHAADGSVLPGCLVFHGRTADEKLCLAVANLQDREQAFVLKSASCSPEMRFRDPLTGENVTPGTTPVTMGAHQVRILVPIGPG